MSNLRHSRARTRRRAVAHHEAGHAVMAHVLGTRVAGVTIRASGDARGATHLHPQGAGGRLAVRLFRGETVSAQAVEAAIMVCLAGTLAEKKLTGRRNLRGARKDFTDANDLAMHHCGDGEQAAAFLRWLNLRAAATIAGPVWWPVVEAVAAALVERETLTADELHQVIDGAADVPSAVGS